MGTFSVVKARERLYRLREIQSADKKEILLIDTVVISQKLIEVVMKTNTKR